VRRRDTLTSDIGNLAASVTKRRVAAQIEWKALWEVTRLDELGEIYEQYGGMIFCFLMRLCQNRDLAQELTQETFYQALKGWKRYRGDAGVSTWLCGIAKRLYWASLRKQAPVPLSSAAESQAPDFAERLVTADRAMAAQRLLHELAEPYREVFTLRTFCDLSHAQIGELFLKSESWARVTYYRARKMLAEGMKESDDYET
jgi:RNA polymerase sigma-70 factor, ECF subfamily